MKNRIVLTFLILITANICYSQAWMTSLDIAQKLAVIQNKMVLMVWEETTQYPYPVLVKDNSGRTVFIQNLFEDENVSPLIWKHFVPVIVSENQYADLYDEIKGKRPQVYMDKFNDDSIKILDANGTIINFRDFSEDYENITSIIQKYALDTAFITPELIGFRKEKSFYSAYYLASKYLDFALYADTKTRPSIIDLSNIYLDESIELAKKNTKEESSLLHQRSELLRLQQSLVLKRPKKVIRRLKKMKVDTIENVNTELVSFLYYTAYMSSGDEKKAALWKSKVSLVNLKKATLIINLNT